MSNVLDRAKTHFGDLLKKELQFVEVPEWPDEEGNPTKIYFRGSSNLMQSQEIGSLERKGKSGEAAAVALIQRALDENGKRMFKDADRIVLTRSVSADVIASIIVKMANLKQSIDDDELEKN